MRTLIIILFFCSSVWASDIYVEQTGNDKPSEQNKPAFIEKKPESVEKELISGTPREYCSVISGCQ